MKSKHIKALANMVRNLPLKKEEKETVIEGVGGVCASFNPKFDWKKWNTLCKKAL